MKNIKTRDLIYCALFAALTAIGAFLHFQLFQATITLQFFFTAMAGLLLGAKLGAALKSNADKAAALQTALAGAGNCSMETQSYTGNGKYGQNNPNTVFCQVCLKNSHLIFYWDSAAYGIIADANFRELAFPVQAGQVLPSGLRGDIQ